ncbi:signal peptidase I [Luteolibacter sp. Populi]|uniref:signal peptidase I n=1 Tax=Luteolibacter sp. Populi TaxID=3230487 RepID=UPI00346730D0
MSRRKFSFLLRTALVVLGVVFVLVFATGTLKLYQNPTRSMSPTIEPGDRAIATRILNPAKRVKRGDVVAFDATRAHPGFTGKFIQRVVALGGDRIEWDGGELRVNGVALPERAGLKPQRAQGPLKPGTPLPSYPLVIPPGSVFTMGDNYGNSLDSRYFGPFPIDAVSHSADYIVTPWSRAGKIE